MNKLTYLYLLRTFFFLIKKSTKLVPIKPEPPVTITVFILIVLKGLKKLDMINNLIIQQNQ